MEEWKLLPVILQGGSFALLTVIVLWLLHWVPKWRGEWSRTQEAEQNARIAIAQASKAAVDQVTSSFSAAIEQLNKTHAQNNSELIRASHEEARYEREQCAKQYMVLLETMQETGTLLREHHQMASDYIRREKPGVRKVHRSGEGPGETP